MGTFDWTGVRERVEKLRGSASVFGSGGHHFQLAPRLSEDEVLEIETQWKTALPADYRAFLKKVGAGGAGPYYGIFTLTRTDNGWGWIGDGGDLTSDLSQPWRHTKDWNMDGDPIWDALPEEEAFDDLDAYDDAYELWHDSFCEKYWDSKWTVGGICICHEGCALRNWLVVNGPEAGNIWWDGTADEVGLQYVRHGKDQPDTRLGFFDWYMRWLNLSEKGLDAT